MNFKSTLIIFTPIVLVVAAVAVFNPSFLTWPMVGFLSLGFGCFAGLAAYIMN